MFSSISLLTLTFSPAKRAPHAHTFEPLSLYLPVPRVRLFLVLEQSRILLQQRCLGGLVGLQHLPVVCVVCAIQSARGIASDFGKILFSPSRNCMLKDPSNGLCVVRAIQYACDLRICHYFGTHVVRIAIVYVVWQFSQ